MNKVICPGAAVGNRRRAFVFCKIEVEDGCLSISGVHGPLRSGNALGGCGQILDTVRAIDQMGKGWTPKLLEQFADIWDRWHLNDMQVGCEHQRAEGWGSERLEVGLDKFKAAGWVTEREHPRGVLSKACPVCGYKYGSAWLKEDLPAEVLAFLEALPTELPYTPAWV